MSDEDTVMGVGIPERDPADVERVTRRQLTRMLLELGPFLDAFDAGLWENA